MKNLSKGSVWGPLQPIAAFSLFSLIFLSISRVLLAFWQLDRIDSFNDLIYILGQGLRVDIATLCWLFILPALLSALMPLNGKIGQYWKWILRIWMVGSFAAFSRSKSTDWYPSGPANTSPSQKLAGASPATPAPAFLYLAAMTRTSCPARSLTL